MLQIAFFHYFLWPSDIPLYTSIHFVNEHLCCFHVLAIVTSAAVNKGVHVYFLIIFLSGYVPRSRIAGSYGSSLFSLLRNLMLFSIAAAPIYIPIKSVAGSPGGSDGKESACNVGSLGLIPGLGRSPAEGNGNPLQDFCLENSMDRGA